MQGHPSAADAQLVLAQGWEELALVVESAIAGRSKEVALAALACITGLVAAQGTACPPWCGVAPCAPWVWASRLPPRPSAWCPSRCCHLALLLKGASCCRS